jgi:hypothetical protein
MMNSREFLRPTVIAALLLFAGVSSMTIASADDQPALESSEASPARVEETSREHARKANQAAAEEAAEAVEADTRLELDIRLIGHTSVLLAGDV